LIFGATQQNVKDLIVYGVSSVITFSIFLNVILSAGGVLL